MKAHLKLDWCAWLLFLSLGLVHAGAGADGVCMQAHWQRMLDAYHPRLGRADFEPIRGDVQRLYANSAVPLWFRGGQPTLAAYVLGSHLEQAGTKGLEGDDYEGRHWAEWLMPYPADDCRMLETDLALSISAMRYVSDMRTGRVEPAMLRKMHEAKIIGAPSVSLWGTGTPLREFLHVDDLADALLFLMQKYSDHSHVNVGLGHDQTIRALAEMVREVVGFEGELVFDSSKPDGTPRKLVDTGLINGLGWQARIPLETGLAAAYAWFVEHIAEARV